MNSLNKGLQTLATGWQRHWDGSRGETLLRAWLTELNGLLPPPWRRRHAPRTTSWPLQNEAIGTRPLTLLLGPEQVLEQTLQLPEAALRDLPELLHYEMDRFTPYTSEQVHAAWRVDNTTLEPRCVRLFVIRREELQQILDACSHEGARIRAVDVLDEQGLRQNINLLPRELRDSGDPRQRRLAQLAAGLCLMTAVACMVLWLHARQQQLQAAEVEVDGLREQTQRIERDYRAARAEYDAGLWGLRKKKQYPAAASMLADISHCLPADTWLERLEIEHDHTLNISGNSGNPEKLLEAMQHCKTLTHPRFMGNIRPDAKSGRVRFSMRMQPAGGQQ